MTHEWENMLFASASAASGHRNDGQIIPKAFFHVGEITIYQPEH